MRWVAGVVVLAGCFSRPELHTSDDGSVDDARPIDMVLVDTATDTRSPPGGACPAIYAPDLVAYYDFEQAGGVMDDGVAAALEGTNMGAVATTGRNVGTTALDFSSASAHVRVGTQAALTDLPQITVCAWVRLEALPGLSATVVDKSLDGNVQGWNAYLNTDTGQSYIAFYTPYHAYKLGITPMALGTWTHVCMSWDGSAGPDGITVYRNGGDDGMGKITAGGPTRESDLGHAFVIGRATTSATPNYPFLGDIDEVALYRRVLTPTEILAIYDCN